MERTLPKDKGGVDNNAEYDKGSYRDGAFRNNGQMPSDEEREEEEGRRAGGFERGFIIPGVDPLSQAGGNSAPMEGGHCVYRGGRRLNDNLLFSGGVELDDD